MTEFWSLQDESRFELVDGYRDSLCYEAEFFLHDNIEDGEYSLLNDTILMKSIGYAAGIATRELHVEGGVIKPGRWYQLAERRQKSTLRRLADCGKRVYLLGTTTLVENRKIREHVGGRDVTGEELLERAISAAKRLADQSAVVMIDFQ